MSTLFETDYQAWAQDQATALREAARLRPNLPLAIDWERIADELEGMSRSEARELRSRLAVLLLHLLKWQFQADHRSRSWENTVRHHRTAIAEQLADNPGLGSRLGEILARAYADARIEANRETGLPLATCPYPADDAQDQGFWPA